MFQNIVRYFFSFSIIVLLAGCANQGGKPKVVHHDTPSTQFQQHADRRPEDRTYALDVDNPEVVAVVKSGKIKGTPQEIATLLGKMIYHYKTNEYVLSSEDYRSLDATAALMQTPYMENKQLLIEGHADERGTRNYNMTLSYKRASTMFDYLISKGVPRDRLKIVSYGFEKPFQYCKKDVPIVNCPSDNIVVADHHNSYDWYLNRRVHLVVLNADSLHNHTEGKF